MSDQRNSAMAGAAKAYPAATLRRPVMPSNCCGKETTFVSKAGHRAERRRCSQCAKTAIY